MEQGILHTVVLHPRCLSRNRDPDNHRDGDPVSILRALGSVFHVYKFHGFFIYNASAYDLYHKDRQSSGQDIKSPSLYNGIGFLDHIYDPSYKHMVYGLYLLLHA